jgi:MoxR-like ATPase
MHSIKKLADTIRENVRRVVVGEDTWLDLLLIALIARGHVLLEDVPGMGKTLTAKALARSIGCTSKRIQFTPDLLPSDVSGIYYYNQKTGEFAFRPGAVFSNILLADEINRATPRTQASLLECMEERQVTIDGVTHQLEEPFFVIATQNPVEIQGTFPLPEAQLDRFLLRVRIGYPSQGQGVEILRRFRQQDPLQEIGPVATAEDILAAQAAYSRVHVSEALYVYIVDIAEKSRSHPDVTLGVSPRGTQALLKAAQVKAILSGRDYVLPEDVRAVAEPALCHRIRLRSMASRSAEAVIADILAHTPVPTEDSLFQGAM